jgi:hypothetical protein
MVELISLPNPGNEPALQLYERELRRLKGKEALQRRLLEIDKIRSFRRIYVMGCGRSGTWLLTHLIGTFKDTEVVRKELNIAHFGLFITKCSALVLKRDHVAYQAIEEIPESIEIAYIIRHPFDVLTSHLPSSGRPYHILPERWLGEMKSLEFLLDTQRKNTKIIRYEDFVTNPVEIQSDVASFFGLRIGVSINELYTISDNPAEGPTHRARKLDMQSINKHKREPNKLKYLREIRPGLGRTLDWVALTYNYDTSLAVS